MPLASMPAIDARACQGWTEQDINLYNSVPYFLAEMQVARRKTWMIWNKFVGSIRWQPNQGPIMRSVRKEPSPHMRQMAFPTAICDMPKKDVMDIREVSVDSVVYRHRFESPILSFCPDFRDFMKNHVVSNGDDIMEKMERFEDIFLRGQIFHNSPKVWIPSQKSGSLVAAPIGTGNAEGTDGKSTAWLQQIFQQIDGSLSLTTLNVLATAAETDVRIPAWKGSGLPKDGVGLTDKYGLVCSTEAWNQFTFDPWLLANKNCSLDVVNASFKGDFFGKVTAILEDLPIRFAEDGTMPYPEIRELNPDAYNYGETVPNPAYTDPAQAPYEVAFFVGARGYDAIEVGPPPSQFSGNGMPKGFGKMFWNGEVEATKNFNIPCVDEAGNVSWETNKYGEYLMFIAQATYGIRANQRRNVIPIIFKRQRGIA